MGWDFLGLPNTAIHLNRPHESLVEILNFLRPGDGCVQRVRPQPALPPNSAATTCYRVGTKPAGSPSSSDASMGSTSPLPRITLDPACLLRVNGWEMEGF